MTQRSLATKDARMEEKKKGREKKKKKKEKGKNSVV